MRDVKAEYLRLFAIELTNYGQELLDAIKNPGTKKIEDIVSDYTNKMYDISNADFTEPDEDEIPEGMPF